MTVLRHSCYVTVQQEGDHEYSNLERVGNLPTKEENEHYQSLLKLKAMEQEYPDWYDHSE